MYPLLQADPAKAAWIQTTATDLARFGDEHRAELDAANRDKRFPRDLYRGLGKLGYLGPLVPEASGGLGGGVAEYVTISEEVGRHGLVSGQIAAQGQRWLLDWGSEAQKERWLRPIATGEAVLWRLDDRGIIGVREREPGALFTGYVTANGTDPARDADGWFDTADLGRADGADYLVFLERAAESIRVKGEFVPIPYVENHLAAVAGLTDHALWKRRGALVDDEVVLYAVADPLPIDGLRRRIADLPAFMRPVAVARVGALPRYAAAGKVQRRLLAEQPVLDWVELS